jgi:predicted alpha/beta superfamily hydrolase
MTAYPTTERFPLKSAAIGTTYAIRIASPENLQEDAKDVPIFIVLDADIQFDLAAEVARLRAIDSTLQKAFIVGVGYGVGFLEMAKLRTKDLTEPLSEDGKRRLASMTNLIGDDHGGAETFLSFLVDELIPEVGRRRPEASTKRSILFGHSLGGLFVAYALLARPDAFASYLASSPSLWWDEFAVLRHLPAFAERLKALPKAPRVLVAVGAQEQDEPTEMDPARGVTMEDAKALVAAARMVDAASEFARTLCALGLPEVRHVAFADEGHASCIPAAMSRAITVALKKTT